MKLSSLIETVDTSTIKEGDVFVGLSPNPNDISRIDDMRFVTEVYPTYVVTRWLFSAKHAYDFTTSYNTFRDDPKVQKLSDKEIVRNLLMLVSMKDPMMVAYYDDDTFEMVEQAIYNLKRYGKTIPDLDVIARSLEKR